MIGVTPDDDQRGRALTKLEATLLVEAAAGTGKTSLLAGRVAMLLASGSPPSSIAAITFTERAATELRTRLAKFAAAFVDGKIPDDLTPAFRTSPLTDEQKQAVAAVRPQLGELTASTIHAFCLTILQTYTVEGRVDPGAAVMDGDQTDLAFESVFDNWLTERLGETASEDDPVVIMAAHDPGRAVKTLRALAKFRRAHPDAVPEKPPSYTDAVHDFLDAVATFRRWINPLSKPEDVELDVAAFEELVAHLEPATRGSLSFAELCSCVHPRNERLIGWNRHSLYAYKARLRDWRKAAGKDDGDRLSTEGREYYERCSTLFQQAIGAIADTLLARFFNETNELVAKFEAFKHDAAVLDFDDILVRTRDLLRSNRRVRDDVAARYRHILVDEFQDTDPIQCEILFLIGSEVGDEPLWHKRALRPGALFMVGDPKQAIYRFRGADLKTYLRAKQAIVTQFPANIIDITANFRSGKSILEHVDKCFAERLARQQGGYRTLDPTVADDKSRGPSVAQYPYHINPTKWIDDVRDADARAVASLCDEIVGNLKVRRADNSIVLAEPGDIALLAPARTDLWRYEHALEEKGLPIASQAGKNLYRRQEAQDFVALVRALADSRDTLALGAVLRGPLVGLSEHDLLNITQSLKTQGIESLTIRTPPDCVPHEVCRMVMIILHALWRKRRGTTPYAILSEAIERLRVIPSIATRRRDQRARSLGNLNSLMERARGYHVRGLKQLAIDLGTEWDGSDISTDEGPPDHRGDSIEIVTIHKAKGLEWPVVIPINLVAMPSRRNEFFFRPGDGATPGTVHWTFGEIASSTLARAVAEDRQESDQERERLLYVACTRAIDALIVPAPSWSPDESWQKFFDLGVGSLPPFKVPKSVSPAAVVVSTLTAQSAEEFAQEAACIAAASPRIAWRRPSAADSDREFLDRATTDATIGDSLDNERVSIAGMGPLRGIVLHKLMEELLVGLLPPDVMPLSQRAIELVAQLSFDNTVRPDSAELAATTLRTFSDDRLAAYRARLVPEFPLFGARSEHELVSARADAVVIDNGIPVAAFDWKSDIAPLPQVRVAYRSQLLEYLSLCGATTGAVVYMSSTPPEFDFVSLDKNSLIL